MNENFRRACLHIGWGDPAPEGLWFIGIEETIKWQQSILDRYVASDNSEKPTYDPHDENAVDEHAAERRKTRIPEWESKIACRISAEALQASMDYRTYRKNCLWFRGSRVFSANLLPLGKPRTRDWPSDYRELFELGPEDQARYFEQVREIRYPALREFWECKRPAATIAFGKTYWEEFRKALRLEAPSAHSPEGGVQYYEDQRVVLAPFFGYGHMRKDIVDKICEKLKDWGIQLP